MEHFGRSESGCTVADDHDAVRMLRRLPPGAPLSHEGFATATRLASTVISSAYAETGDVALAGSCAAANAHWQ
jgi:hypothetical protein